MAVRALCEMYSSSRDTSEESPFISGRRLDWMDRILRLVRGERF